jgi:hypothetical protein
MVEVQTDEVHAIPCFLNTGVALVNIADGTSETTACGLL